MFNAQLKNLKDSVIIEIEKFGELDFIPYLCEGEFDVSVREDLSLLVTEDVLTHIPCDVDVYDIITGEVLSVWVVGWDGEVLTYIDSKYLEVGRCDLHRIAGVDSLVEVLTILNNVKNYKK